MKAYTQGGGTIVYNLVVDVCKPYLGDEADSFLSRQCVFHLRTAPKQIDRHDIPELARWAEISGRLVLGKDKAKEMRIQIESLLKR